MTSKRVEETNDWRLENVELISWLFSQGDDCHVFLLDMQRTIKKFGALTSRQQEAVEKWKAASESREEGKKADDEISKDAPALVAGKREFTGEILSTKWHSGAYGESLKMTVRLIDGNKVWGTVPVDLHESSEIKMPSDLVGRNVAFTATLKVAPDNEHFGFFRRPTQARFC